MSNQRRTNLRELSRREYQLLDNLVLNPELVQLGALQRIADGMDLIAKRYAETLEQLQNYKQWYAEERDSNIKLRREISQQKGQITKLRNQLKKGREQQYGA